MSSGDPVVPGRFRQLWRKRGVLALLVRRDLKVRYSDSMLGYVWSVLDPLMMGLIYWFVFTKIFERSVGEDPYIVFLLSGMLPFMWFQNAVGDSARALRGEKLVRTTALPRELWVLRLVLAKGCEYVFSLPVLALFAIAYKAEVSLHVLWMPVAMLLQLVLVAGIAMIVAPLTVLVRDVDRVVRILLRFLFYATPIIYGVGNVVDDTALPAALRTLYLFNPMTGIISLYRAPFFATELRWDAIGIAAGMSVLLLVVGWAVFRRLEPAVLKEI